MSEVNTNLSERDYPDLYFKLCNCAGPQPSRANTRADEHAKECPYRLEIESDVKNLS
jgi:hypothetical protein